VNDRKATPCEARRCKWLASTLVVEFRVDPQCRAAVELRWPSGQSAKVEL
jgi:hypothetical protein